MPAKKVELNIIHSPLVEDVPNEPDKKLIKPKTKAEVINDGVKALKKSGKFSDEKIEAAKKLMKGGKPKIKASDIKESLEIKQTIKPASPERRATLKAAKKLPEVKTIKQTIKDAEEKKLIVVLSTNTTYDINFLYIRRIFIRLGRLFKRKDSLKPAVEAVSLPPKTTRLSLYARYAYWFNKRFNDYPELKNVEELFEEDDLKNIRNGGKEVRLEVIPMEELGGI